MQNFPKLTAANVVPWVVAILITIHSFNIDKTIVNQGGSIDLRNRITGARLMRDGYDAFHYKWRSGDPDIYCDVYNHLSLKISKTTVSPTCMSLLLPIAGLNYAEVQLWWLLSQWVMLIGTAIVWWMILPKWWQKVTILGFLILYTYTFPWRLHIDRGQIYIHYIFFISLWIFLTRLQNKRASQVAGVIGALLVGLRPPFLLLLAPVIWLKDRNQILPAVIAGAIFFVMPMVPRASAWGDFASGMKDWSEYYRKFEPIPRSVGQAYPDKLEGMDINQVARVVVRQYADSSLFRMLKYLKISNFPSWPITLLLLGLLGWWFWKFRDQELHFLLVGIAAWVFLIDWFLPAYRNPYNDVLGFGAVAFALLRKNPLWFAISLLAFPIGYFFYRTLPGSGNRWCLFLPTICFLFPAIVALFPEREIDKKVDN